MKTKTVGMGNTIILIFSEIFLIKHQRLTGIYICLLTFGKVKLVFNQLINKTFKFISSTQLKLALKTVLS